MSVTVMFMLGVMFVDAVTQREDGRNGVHAA